MILLKLVDKFIEVIGQYKPSRTGFLSTFGVDAEITQKKIEASGLLKKTLESFKTTLEEKIQKRSFDLLLEFESLKTKLQNGLKSSEEIRKNTPPADYDGFIDSCIATMDGALEFYQLSSLSKEKKEMKEDKEKKEALEDLCDILENDLLTCYVDMEYRRCLLNSSKSRRTRVLTTLSSSEKSEQQLTETLIKLLKDILFKLRESCHSIPKESEQYYLILALNIEAALWEESDKSKQLGLAETPLRKILLDTKEKIEELKGAKKALKKLNEKQATALEQAKYDARDFLNKAYETGHPELLEKKKKEEEQKKKEEEQKKKEEEEQKQKEAKEKLEKERDEAASKQAAEEKLKKEAEEKKKKEEEEQKKKEEEQRIEAARKQAEEQRKKEEEKTQKDSAEKSAAVGAGKGLNGKRHSSGKK